MWFSIISGLSFNCFQVNRFDAPNLVIFMNATNIFIQFHEKESHLLIILINHIWIRSFVFSWGHDFMYFNAMIIKCCNKQMTMNLINSDVEISYLGATFRMKICWEHWFSPRNMLICYHLFNHQSAFRILVWHRNIYRIWFRSYFVWVALIYQFHNRFDTE